MPARLPCSLWDMIPILSDRPGQDRNHVPHTMPLG
jgi:hypothetical protein